MFVGWHAALMQHSCSTLGHRAALLGSPQHSCGRVGTMPPSEVERGPCKVAAAGCLGKEPSKNSQHGDGDGKGKHVDWRWRKASKVGTITATHERFGGTWAFHIERYACRGDITHTVPRILLTVSR